MAQKLNFPVFDGDNHLYETREALTRFLPPEYQGAIRYVEVDGRVKIATMGQISDYIPNPTFDRVGRPGAQEEYFKIGNPEGKSHREIIGRGIDCPPALSLITINAFVAADEVIIPLQCEYFGMKGMQQLQRTIDRVRHKLNPQLRIAGILPTIFKSRTLHSQEVLDLVKEHYGDQVFEVRVDASIRFAECPLEGQSILQYANASPGAKAYRALAAAVLNGDGAEGEGGQ